MNMRREMGFSSENKDKKTPELGSKRVELTSEETVEIEERWFRSERNCTTPPSEFVKFMKDAAAALSRVVVKGTIVSGAAFEMMPTEVGAEGKVETPVEEARAGTLEEYEEDLDRAHADAAQELRENETLNKYYSPQEIEAVAKGIEAFSAGKFFDVLLEKTDLSEAELLKLHHSRDVYVYSAESMGAYVHHRALKDQDVKRALVHGLTALPHVLESVRSAGGLNGSGLIYLNLSEIVREGAHDPRELEMLTTDILYHEHLHSFPKEHFWREMGNDSYEGITELLSNVMLKEAHGAKDAYSGYIDGNTATAAVMYESLDEEGKKVFWHAYVTDNANELRDIYNEQVDDEHAFGDLLHADYVKEWRGRLKWDKVMRPFARLDYAVHKAVPEGDDFSVVERANTWLGKNQIIPIRGQDFHGVALLDRKDKASGIIRFEDSPGSRVIVISPSSPKDIAAVKNIPREPVTLFTPPLSEEGAPEGQLFNRSLEERGAVMVKAIKEYRETIDFQRIF